MRRARIGGPLAAPPAGGPPPSEPGATLLGMLHTLISVDDGVVQARIISEVSLDLSERRWRAAVLPAIVLLRAIGGGTLCVPHDPLTLLA